MSTVGVASLLLVALVALLGSAQAAPSTKFYNGIVRVKLDTTPSATAATLTVTFTNDTRGRQPLGSAHFTPPAGVRVDSVVNPPVDPVTNTTRTGWTAALEDGDATFKSGSNGVALQPGESVSTSVDVTITSASDCRNASPPGTWKARAKQSNDFSGSPGNDATLKLDRSNLRPLGSFTFAQIGTQVEDGPFVRQQVLTSPSPTNKSRPTSIGVTATDLCGAELDDYGSGDDGHFGDAAAITKADAIPERLVGATISSIAWTDNTGDGLAALEPVVVETGDNLVVTDDLTGIHATSDEFDVVEELCYFGLTTCTWQDKKVNPGILARADPPPAGASLGLGFNPNLETFSCDGKDKDDLVGGTFINVNPRDYAVNATVTIALTYKKSITGNGPASSFDLCLSDDNGQTWEKTDAGGPVPACSSVAPALAEAPCTIEKKRISGGDLSVILFIAADDPWGGLG